MGSTWGNRIKLSLFGESHGPAIGIVIDGLPPGELLDDGKIRREMLRRAPGRSAHATPRREGDEVELLSGILDGKTTGAPLAALIRNTDTRSRDYDSKLRPGHADLTAQLKYGGHADLRGGGHFSGRLTAPLTFAGAVAKQILARRGVTVYGRITRIGGVAETEQPVTPDELQAAASAAFPAFGADLSSQMQAEIAAAKEAQDSIGGIVESVALGVPPALGEPFFHSLESELAAMLFSIPAVKGVEFGDGFKLTSCRASEVNDSILSKDGTTATNHSGGVLGGITNGMPLVVRAAFKPTPSISQEQQTVDGATGEPTPITIKGRHDPCIVPRAVPVVEAGVALVLLDLWMRHKGVAL